MGKGTQKDWAKDHGLHEVTVSEWKSDEFVVGLLRKANTMMEPVWAAALGTLARIATDENHPQVVQAIRELGKLLDKYPSEKVNVSVDRVAYVEPDVLVKHARNLYPELTKN